ncbi:Uncharacterised protein [Candidatus Bilamarchaeum dharawalense]|uniref:Uncharacterized protein n=1 Tax=Candidatus Bilamarchaeum dharawalense TaxID=2885759 RepID=A0A5E4LW10_9ARCH|nr:Uncharacterised protein [Candidatus Bilamarchaeum dharawalense]
MSDVEKLTRDTVANGGILAMLYFDIHAKTKELVQELGTGFINEVIQKQGVVFALGEIDEPTGGDEKTNWSSSIQLKVLTKDFATLAAICMANSPYSIEILRPDAVKLSLADAHSLLGTMSATTAEYKKYILTKLSKPDELARLQENLKKRAEMGKNILKKGEK